MQDEYFKVDEGDHWFLRNKEAIISKKKLSTDIPLNLIEEYNILPKKVLEIGCSNGYRLQSFLPNTSKIVGVDVSREAIKDGIQRYPGLDLKVGEICHLPIEDEKFDLVIVNYVLTWIDRKNIFKALSEIDTK